MAHPTPAIPLARAAAPACAGGGVGAGAPGQRLDRGDRPYPTAAAAVQGALVTLTKTPARDLGPDAVAVDEVVVDPASPPSPEVVAAAVSSLCGDPAGAVAVQLLTLGRGGPLRP